ncbi:MAG: UDP-N-acetylmuramoyl-L-alanine--D-glutamate ligase [Phycisphaerae bacterium]|nr:UDP-N-acetylmuramoyl-L-alanine--D-glutamate ligase [Phycisphaerae bacterium]MCZ2399992.1 UDP-N-acetylmuramoyl-L-alanine--D-glutamate ligase [Phycisphaerae bacterium]
MDGWRGKRVTVMGLGRFGGGVGVTRWLARQGARVLVTDQAPAEALRSSLAAIGGLDVALRLGEHDERDFRDTDAVVVNPAIPDRSPFVQAALAAGVPITTEINLFVERCPARCVGVTGSVGKSTVTAMIGAALEALPGGRTWVGGNLGDSLLPSLESIRASDVVVLELSSFQLHRTPLVRWSPHIAVITNVTPNHLDWHGTFAAYVADKLNIVRFQEPGRDWAVVHDSPDLRRRFDELFGDNAGLYRYRLDGETPVAAAQTTSAVEHDDVRLRWEGLALAVPGRHNRENAAAALAVAHLLGVEREAALAALARFEGLPHRLKRVGERGGVTYVDDSKSTTPEAALTAIDAIGGPLLLILGGYDKGSDLTALARRAAQRARLSACIGKTGPALADAIAAAGGAAQRCETLGDAVAACRVAARPGDTVLLSPGCASWDMFEDYRARGTQFARLALEGRGTP